MQRMPEEDYRSIISRELEARKRRRSGYSLRAFARDLKIPAPKLSQIISGTCGISPTRAAKIAKAIGLSAEEKELFTLMVTAQHSRSLAERKQAETKIAKLKSTDGFGPLALERFKIISDWYYSAILELVKLKSFKPDTKWISSRLGVEKEFIETALERLVDFGLLKRDQNANLERTDNFLATPSGIPSREIREHHSQILNKADQALDRVPVEQRDFSTMTMAIDSSRMEEARAALRDFRRNFCKEIQSSPDKNRVYCLAIQFFPLEKGDSHDSI